VLTREVLSRPPLMPLAQNLAQNHHTSHVGTTRIPSIFCVRSLGGVLTKEMLARGLAAPPGFDSRAARIAQNTIGLATYATPHAGSWLADWGWNLRYLGAAPDPVVSHLKPGAHLEVRTSSRLDGRVALISSPIGRFFALLLVSCRGSQDPLGRANLLSDCCPTVGH